MLRAACRGCRCGAKKWATLRTFLISPLRGQKWTDLLQVCPLLLGNEECPHFFRRHRSLPTRDSLMDESLARWRARLAHRWLISDGGAAMPTPSAARGFPLPSTSRSCRAPRRAGGLPVLHAVHAARTTSASGSTTRCTSPSRCRLRHGHRRGGVLRAGRVQHPRALLPTTHGIDHRMINGRVYIGGNGVTDPAEIERAHRGVQAARVLLLRALGDACTTSGRSRCRR